MVKRTLLFALVILFTAGVARGSEFSLRMDWSGVDFDWRELDGADADSGWDFCWRLALDFWPVHRAFAGLELGWAVFPLTTESTDDGLTTIQQRVVWQEGAIRAGLAPLNEIIRPVLFAKLRYAWADFDVGFDDRAYWIVSGGAGVDVLLSADLGLFAFGEYGAALDGSVIQQALGGGIMLRF